MNPTYLKPFWITNLFLTASIYFAFFWHFEGFNMESFLFGILATLSSAILLSVIIFIFSSLCFWRKSWQLRCMAILFIFVDMALLIDFFIYKLFHFHINAMVLNIFTSPDAQDSIQSGLAPIILFFLCFGILIYLQFYLLKKSTTSIQKSYKKLFLFLFLIVLTDKLIFGFASLFSYNRLIAPVKVIPLYQPFTFTKVAAKYFGFKAEAQAKYAISTPGQLHYPLTHLTFEKNSPNFPIYIIAFDSVASSAITYQSAPNITRFSQDALVLSNHHSGGNSTRFGIFSLIYGLNATYWFSFLAANQKPVLFDILQKKGYEIGILDCIST